MAPPEVAAHALILADGAVATRARLDAAWPGWDAGVDLVVAADGGARHAAALGIRPDLWVGDGDSIDAGALAALAAAGVELRRAPAEKDETDAELALLAAIGRGAAQLTILGALGGARVDHELANVGLLQHPALTGRPARLYDEQAARISLLTGPAERDLAGRIGDLVSLVPAAGSAVGVRTEGLRYLLAGEVLVPGRTRGISNVRTAQVARVTLESGRLLVIETPANLRR